MDVRKSRNKKGPEGIEKRHPKPHRVPPSQGKIKGVYNENILLVESNRNKPPFQGRGLTFPYEYRVTQRAVRFVLHHRIIRK